MPWVHPIRTFGLTLPVAGHIRGPKVRLPRSKPGASGGVYKDQADLPCEQWPLVGVCATLYDSRMEFEWDSEKAARNAAKHGVSFVEAATVFGDPLAITYFDPYHSDKEDRFLTFGQAGDGRMLLVSHVDRADCIRIISARLMTRTERKQYEEGQDQSKG